MSSIHYDLEKIKGFIFDVDGVLSTESIPLHPSGEPMRVINTKDGYAMQLAAKKGFILAIITGGYTEAVRKRFEGLGCRYIYQKSKVKINDFQDLLNQTGLKPEDLVYAGDDIPDIEVMKKVGLPICPKDAVPEVKSVSKYISDRRGGCGVARDVIEQVLKAQNKWMTSDAFGW